MEYTVIKNEKQYNKAINRLEHIFDAKKSTPEGNELELLTLLIDK
jgi:HTH-type transcriptional regulator/antitoxin HigA